MTDADQQVPNSEMADGSQQHLREEAHDAGQQLPPIDAYLDEERHDSVAEKIETDQHVLFVANEGEGQHDSITAKAETDSQVPLDAGATKERHESVAEKIEPDQQLPLVENPEESEHYSVTEKTETDPQVPLAAIPDEERHESVAEKIEPDQHVLFVENPDESQHDSATEKTEPDPQVPFDAIPDEERHDSVAEKTETDQRAPGGETVDENQYHLADEANVGNLQVPFDANQDEGQHDSIAEKSETDQQFPVVAKPEEERRDSVAAKTETDQQVPLEAEPAASQQYSSVEPQRKEANRVFLYGAICIGIGLLAGIAFAAFTWRESKPAPPPEPVAALEPSVSHELRDLGFDDSSTAGLKGHLTTQWVEKPEYRLVVEPIDPAQQAEFARTVSDPPRPLSIGIHLKDAAGVVLCSTSVVLKYVPKDMHGPTAAGAKKNQEAGIDQQAALEQEREHGKDIFKNDVGPDGRIQSISADGEIPCSKSAYASTVVWSLQPDFPTMDEQAKLPNRQTETMATPTRSITRISSQKSSAQPRMAPKSAVSSSMLLMEGDDAIIDFDSAGGIIETREGKSFLIDKTGGEAAAMSGYDFPLRFHYRCDQTLACVLTRGGAPFVHAMLKR